MLFKLDENLPATAVAMLRDAGHDAITVLQQGMGGEPDARVAGAIRSEVRALVTLDLGFSDIRAYPPEDYPGIIVLRLARQDKSSIEATLRNLLPILRQEPLAGHLWIVEENSMRMRGGD